MRYARVAFLAASLVGASAIAQQPAGSPAQPAQQPLEIYQIDLVPSGTGFAVTKPVLEGDVYVFKVWPDRATVRLPKARVKRMIARTKDVSNEVLYQIDLVPSGQMFARDAPTLKGNTYVFHTWKQGTLASLRPSDVKTITRLTGLDAFRVHLQQFGVKPIGDLAMQGGTVHGTTAAPAADNPAAASSSNQTPYNWIYQGVPGVTDAWAPPSAVVSAPGDVPKAPEPHR